MMKRENIKIAAIGAAAMVAAALIQARRGSESEPTSFAHSSGENSIAINQARDIEINQTTTQETPTSGRIRPANQPTPAHDCPVQSSESTILFVGARPHLLPRDQKKMTIIQWRGQTILEIVREPAGILVSAEFRRHDGRIVAKLVDNEFSINENNYFEANTQPDDHELRVVDRMGNIAARVRFINESTIWIEGEFLIPGRGILLASSDRLTFPDGGTIIGGCTGAVGVAYNFN